jgi:hypothetical protein
MKAPVTNSRCVKHYGRRVAGSWGRPKQNLRKEANRAARRAVKEMLKP